MVNKLKSKILVTHHTYTKKSPDNPAADIAKSMVKFLKFNLHSLFIAIASVLYVSKQNQNLIVNHTQLQHTA